MPYKPTSQSAQHALDEVQQLAAQQQYSWLSGLDTTLSGSTSSIETTVGSGTVVFDSKTIDVAGGNYAHPDGDTDNPRWDALVVTDSDGTVEVFSGIPNETVADQNGDPIRGEGAFSPAPSDNITAEMVCLALVWIPAGATNNTDLTDEANGGVASPVVDRRVYQAGRIDQTTRRATITSSGWHTIASQSPLGTGPDTSLKLANGLFTVRDTQAGRTSSTTFWASHMDGERPTIRVVSSSAGSSPRAVQGIRIVSGPDEATDGAEVQINVQLNTNSQVSVVEYTLQNNYHYGGWWPENWQAGTIPSGYDSTDIYWRNGSGHVLASSNDWSTTAQFSVDRSGNVAANRVEKQETAARVWLSSAITVDGSGQTIPYDTVKTDDWGAWDTSTGVFTVPYDGWYTVHGHARLEGASNEQRLDLLVLHNGGGQAITRIPIGAGKVTTFGVQTIIDATAGDTIEIEERHGGGGTNTIAGNPRETYATIVHEG